MCSLLSSRVCIISLLLLLNSVMFTIVLFLSKSFFFSEFLILKLMLKFKKYFVLQPCRIYVLWVLCCSCLQTSGPIHYVSNTRFCLSGRRLGITSQLLHHRSNLLLHAYCHILDFIRNLTFYLILYIGYEKLSYCFSLNISF